MIGGTLCTTSVAAGLFNAAEQTLTPYERQVLWQLFQQIGITWKDLHPNKMDSSNLKSSWLDFIKAKAESPPSYVAEYSNAVLCIDELIELHGDQEVYRLLLLDYQIPAGAPLMRLAHAKRYVVDEFIRVNIVASGFKSFAAPDNNGKNYKGYIGGSRYNLRARVRAYEPQNGEG